MSDNPRENQQIGMEHFFDEKDVAQALFSLEADRWEPIAEGYCYQAKIGQLYARVGRRPIQEQGVTKRIYFININYPGREEYETPHRAKELFEYIEHICASAN